MPKSLQPKKLRINNRKKAIVAANFMSYRALFLAVQETLGTEISYGSFMKTIYGELVSGPKAEMVMETISNLVKRKVETLWPEIRENAA